MRPDLGPPDHEVEPADDGLGRPDRERRFGPGAILLVLLVVGLGLGAWTYVTFANDGWMRDIDDGLDAAKASGKPILVYYTADWCPPCKQLRATVLADPDVEAALAAKFVRVKVDLTSRGGRNAQIADEQGVHAIPTMILYDANGNERERVTGGDLVGWLYAKTAG